MSRLPFSHIIIPKSEADISPLWGCFTTILCFVAVMLTLCLLTCCRTVYVPVETVHSDTLVVSKWQHDSVYIDKYLHDSVYIHDRGDTVLIEKWHTQFIDRWREREVHDTLVSIKVDSIQVPYPVEKKLGFWEKTKLVSTGFVGALIVGGIAGVALWIRRRYKRM